MDKLYYTQSFEKWCWRRLEKIKWSEKVTNEQVLGYIGEKTTLLKISYVEKQIGLAIFREDCLLHDDIE